MTGSGHSVLQGRTARDVRAEPFAHLVNDAPFSAEHYDRLAAGFPDVPGFLPGGFRPGSNQAIRIPARMVLDDPAFPGPWRSFFAHHASAAFWREIVAVFGPGIRAARPGLEDRAGRPLEAWRPKLRGTPGEADVELDVLFVINTPVARRGSVRPANVDEGGKIFAGLFYMRDPGDETAGGDLALYRFKPGRGAFGGHYARLGDLEECRRIAYRANRFIGFVNSPQSIHGVTPRAPTRRLRRYINFVAVSRFATFDLPRLPTLARLRFSLARRRTKRKGITIGVECPAPAPAAPARHRQAGCLP